MNPTTCLGIVKNETCKGPLGRVFENMFKVLRFVMNLKKRPKSSFFLATAKNLWDMFCEHKGELNPKNETIWILKKLDTQSTPKNDVP